MGRARARRGCKFIYNILIRTRVRARFDLNKLYFKQVWPRTICKRAALLCGAKNIYLFMLLDTFQKNTTFERATDTRHAIAIAITITINITAIKPGWLPPRQAHALAPAYLCYK